MGGMAGRSAAILQLYDTTMSNEQVPTRPRLMAWGWHPDFAYPDLATIPGVRPGKHGGGQGAKMSKTAVDRGDEATTILGLRFFRI